MKRTLLIPLFILLFASTGWCYFIDDTNAGALDGADVGSVDLLLAESSFTPSDPATELAWVNSVLAPGSTTFTVKEEPVTYYNTDDNDVFAFSILSSSEYYIVKNSTWHALYENIAEFDWGVFNVDVLDEGFNLPGSEYTISHVSQFGDNPVPEPSTLLLLGAGLAGLAVYRRKVKK